MLIVGIIALLVSLVAATALVVEHVGGLSLPGCGPGGACAELTRGPWGRISLGSLVWPVSHAGAAYFAALLAAWLAVRGAAPRELRWIVRLGALGSVGFVLVMLFKQSVCWYCLAVHAGNLCFWLTTEFSPRALRAGRSLLAGLGTFIVATAGLAMLEAGTRSRVVAEAEGARSQSTAQMIEHSQRPVATTSAPSTAPATTRAAEISPTASAPALENPSAAQDTGLTGRYRTGPLDAPIRIVMFNDYQCEDCARIEAQVTKLLRDRQDVSIAIRYFPFNSECNPYVPGTPHPNACWAARAAEAAGMLWGADGFWKMHRWLFDRTGRFETQAELEGGIRSLGYEPGNFVDTMAGPETLRRVREDIELAKDLGIYFTPMIFINGVELKGWNAPDALLKTVAELAASNPPRRTPDADHPPRAYEKLVADWRDWNDGQPIVLPAETHEWALGPADARVQVVLWGDYQEPGSIAADKIIRRFQQGRSDVRYVYRHYPFNKECNPRVPDVRFPQACVAARAAEAAGKVGGNDGYWKMHDWLMGHAAQVSDDGVRAAAAELGLDAAAFEAAMRDPAGGAGIREDILAGAKLPQLRHGARPGIYGIPAIFVNGRFVPRWQVNESQPVLEDVLRSAAGEK